MLRSWNSQFKIQIGEHFIYKTGFAILENKKLVALNYTFGHITFKHLSTIALSESITIQV